MGSIARFCKIPTTQLRSKNCLYLYNIVRNSANRDFAPGPYPKTEEERRKAAEKYNLLPEDYKPIPDDGNSHNRGDYPNVPPISVESKDPNYPYDYPVYRRNFNEPMPLIANLITEDRLNLGARHRYPMYVYWLSLVGFVSGLAVLFYVGESYKMVQPRMPKQYPKAGETHYTFEPLK